MMAWVLFFFVLVVLACVLVAWAIQYRALSQVTAENLKLRSEQPNLQRKYEGLYASAQSEIESRMLSLKLDAENIVSDAQKQSDRVLSKAQAELGDLKLLTAKLANESDSYQRTVIAMKNILDGYGDEYLVPTSGLLDDLAEEFSHKDAGVELKNARKNTKLLIKEDRAAECDYVEANRREGAIAFVLDAFNGKVDSALAKVKHHNAGKLSQEIKDAFELVNHGGRAFRSARVTSDFLNARLEELRWGVVVQELREQEREEQRRIREQIREEEKARREYQKAIKEAEKEEGMLKKAMEKAQRLALEATEDRRAEFEAQITELQVQLQDAELKNQRAVSMAQQTRRGHVYVISNVGSFGEDVFKIGLTRRLEPMDRVKELGDASVPFAFDVHAMIMSDDAPALETELHKHFLMNQINKVNHRKEFFRASVSQIREEIESMGIEAKWTMLAEAQDYKETLAIERLIEESPEAQEAWRNRQLTLDPTDLMEEA